MISCFLWPMVSWLANFTVNYRAVFLSPVNNVEGGYRNSQHPFLRPSFRPNVRPKTKSSQSHNFSPIFTKFQKHVYITEKFYTVQFHKKSGKNCCHANRFSFWPLIHICLCLFLTWKHEGTFLSNFYNIFINVQDNFSAIVCKFWQKMLPWQHFHFAIFMIGSLKNDTVSYNCKTFSHISFKISVYVWVHNKNICFLRWP